MNSRPAAVAGLFYPGNSRELHAMVSGFLQEAHCRSVMPKVLVAPHAGYVYSGRMAAEAYAQLRGVAQHIHRVVLLGPCHRVAVRGIALPSVQAFETPLGKIPLDGDALRRLARLPFVAYGDVVHAQEHSLEVHLPFLQTVLNDFSLVPLVVGECTPTEVSEALQALWGGDETLIVISSDLSHFLPYEDAREADDRTAKKILRLQSDLRGEEACGCRPLNGLLLLARQKNMHCELLGLCNSGDTAGDRQRVVGYGSFCLA